MGQSFAFRAALSTIGGCRSRRLVVPAGVMMLSCMMMGCGRAEGRMFPVMDPSVVWPPPPEPARIRLVGMLSGSADLHAARSGLEDFKAALRGPRPPIRFSSPNMVAIGSGGLIAVSDTGLSAVHVVDLVTRSHRLISGWDDERFGAPLGVAWAGQRLFVTDAERHEVIELDAGGGFRRRFGEDVLKRPVGVAYVATRRQLFVVDGGLHRIAVFDEAGSLVHTIGGRGATAGMFNFPSHICHRNGRLLVADSGNFRVQVLDLDGACLRIIGHKGDGAGDLSLPKGVAFDSDGHVYVVDAQFENVQIYDEEGRLLLAFGHEGAGPGEFSLPAGMAIDENDRIWVADAANRRLDVFDYLRVSE